MSEDSNPGAAKPKRSQRRLESSITQRFKATPEQELGFYQSLHKHDSDDTTTCAPERRDSLEEFYSDFHAWLTLAALPSVGSAAGEDEFCHPCRDENACHSDPLVPEPLNLDRLNCNMEDHDIENGNEDDYDAGFHDTSDPDSSLRFRRAVARSRQSSERAISPRTTVSACKFSNFRDLWTTPSHDGAEENLTCYSTSLSHVSPQFSDFDRRSPSRTNPVSTAHPVKFISTPRRKKPVNSRRRRQDDRFSSTDVPIGKANGSETGTRGGRRISVYTPSKHLPNGELHASHHGQNYPSAQQLEAWRRLYPGRGKDTGMGRDLYGWTCANVTFDDICSWSQLARPKLAWYRRPLKYF